MKKEKVAFVVVRYGKNINGGAEYHCQMLAERLVSDYEVEVLTTLSLIHIWADTLLHLVGKRVCPFARDG